MNAAASDGVGLLERSCRIAALDGLSLGATVFEPAAGVGTKAALIASATGVKRERYGSFARFLASQGWAVVTFDYRGIGDSRDGDLKSLPHTMSEWGSKDIAGVIAWIESNWAPAKLAVVGHSVGGQVLPFAPNHDRVGALLTIGCQKGYWKLWSGFERLQCMAFWGLIPVAVRLFGYLPMGFVDCENLPPGVALEWRRWGVHHDFVDADGVSLHDHAAFTAPILAYSFSDDAFAPRAAAEKVLEFYRCAPRQHRHIHPHQLGLKAIGHSGFFTDPAVRERLWHETCEWLERPAMPVESTGTEDSLPGAKAFGLADSAT